LINAEGKMLGVKPLSEALKEAIESDLDLIEISPGATPPVCKVGSLSKYLYEKEKKKKEARKHHSGGQVKEVRFRIKIGEHDFKVKVDRIIKFLKERHKVRVNMAFFGREMQHVDIGQTMLVKIEEAIKGSGVIEQRPKMYGNRMISILVPNKG